jgi:hypothetical protein
MPFLALVSPAGPLAPAHMPDVMLAIQLYPLDFWNSQSMVRREAWLSDRQIIYDRRISWL